MYIRYIRTEVDSLDEPSWHFTDFIFFLLTVKTRFMLPHEYWLNGVALVNDNDNFPLLRSISLNLVDLKGQSNAKVCEIMIWNVSFGLNEGSPTVFKIFKSPRGALGVKPDFQVSWRSAILYSGPPQHAVKVYIIL
jgi:hypothetical protein